MSSRSSGSSYLNHVELQNGCLSLGHANRPSTIHLYKGADSSDLQDSRTGLQVFLKGSKTNKEQLCREKPELYKYFEDVWKVCSYHLVPGLPQQYLFPLICCFRTDCPHPICQSQCQELKETRWYPQGPKLDTIPLPVPDSPRLFGSSDCDSCSGICAGQYLTPEKALVSTIPPHYKPPSTILKELSLSHCGKEISDAMIEDLAMKILLPTSDVVMWLNHLKTIDENQKRGAAETRRKKQQSQIQTLIWRCNGWRQPTQSVGRRHRSCCPTQSHWRSHRPTPIPRRRHRPIQGHWRRHRPTPIHRRRHQPTQSVRRRHTSCRPTQRSHQSHRRRHWPAESWRATQSRHRPAQSHGRRYW